MKTAYLRTPLAVAVMAALAMPAAAQEFLDIEDLVNPRSSVKAGIGYIDGDNRWYGRYHGLVDTTEKGAVPLLDLEYVTRDNDTGTWAKAKVGASGAQFEYGPQGDWGVEVTAQRIETTDVLEYNTGLTGRKSDTQLVAGTALRDVDLEIERRDVRIEATKQLPNDFDLRLSFRNHEREGARGWGTQGFNFVTEPIDATMREMEAAVGYTGDSLQMSGGFYGTSYENDFEVLNSDAGVGSVSLPLDSDSYQLFLNGSYRFTGTTQANFKVSETKATQDENFFDPTVGLTPDLDAEVNTTLVYASLSSRPIDNLSLNANVRYEDRDDDTDEVPGWRSPGATRPGNNVAHSRETTAGKLEATYSLPMGFALVGGIATEEIDRSRPDPSSVNYADTDETSYRLELRKSMHETLNGSVSYTYVDRDTDNVQESGYPATSWVAPLHMMDLEQDKYRLMLDWAPAAPLSLQFVFEYNDDEYDPGTALYGRQEGSSKLISLDVSYRVNEDWTLTGWISRDENEYEGLTECGAGDAACAAAGSWVPDLEFKGDSVGLGVRGLIAYQYPVGADLQYGKDRGSYGVDNTGNVPDIEYKYWRAHLFGEYALDEHSGIRADYVYTKFENDEWAWDDWVYADGTTVNLEDDEDVNFIGVSYYYKWR